MHCPLIENVVILKDRREKIGESTIHTWRSERFPSEVTLSCTAPSLTHSLRTGFLYYLISALLALDKFIN